MLHRDAILTERYGFAQGEQRMAEGGFGGIEERTASEQKHP